MTTAILGGKGPLRIDSGLNVIVDGNSIYADFYTPIATLLASSAAFTGRGASTISCAVSGSLWSTMLGHVSSVSAAFVPGLTNILVAGETTNSMATGGGRTAAEAWADCLTYIAAVRAARPTMRFVLCGSLPCRYLNDGTKNAAMLAWDALALANYRQNGIERFVNYRATVPFNVSGESAGDYPGTHWNGDQVHVNDTGKAIMCDLIGRAIQSMGAR